MTREAGSRPADVAFKTIRPGLLCFVCTIASAIPWNALRWFALNGSWLIWLPLSTPAIDPGPINSNLTRLSANGTSVPFLSTTFTVTNDRSVPSALIVCRSGVKTIFAGCSAVRTSLLNTTCPFFRDTALNNPGSNASRQNTRMSSPCFRFVPCERPFKNSSTSSALLKYATTSTFSPAFQFQCGKMCNTGVLVHSLW